MRYVTANWDVNYENDNGDSSVFDSVSEFLDSLLIMI